jgi:phage protein U
MLIQWGTFQFDIIKFNVAGYEDVVNMELAKKEILGIRPPRELTGLDDSERVLQGKYYPTKLGGMEESELLVKLIENGLPQQMMRGDGKVLGWYSCTRYHETGRYLNNKGIGKEITFEALFFKQPIPTGENYFSNLYGLTG